MDLTPLPPPPASLAPSAPAPSDAPALFATDHALAQLRQQVRNLSAISRALADQVDHLTAQLAEANLRILFIFETFKFSQKGTLLDANGQAQAVQKTLGDLYVMGRDALLQTLEEARATQESHDGEGVPPDADAVRAPGATPSSAPGGALAPYDADCDGSTDASRAPLPFPGTRRLLNIEPPSGA